MRRWSQSTAHSRNGPPGWCASCHPDSLSRSCAMPATDLPARVVEFCRLVRARELQVTPGRAVDAARSLQLVDVADAGAFRAALRANLTISVDEYSAFDEAFDEYWQSLIADDGTRDHFPDLRPTVEGPDR